MSTENPEQNSALHPEIAQILQSRMTQANQAAQNAKINIPNAVVKPDGSTVAPSAPTPRSTRPANGYLPQNLQSAQRGGEPNAGEQPQGSETSKSAQQNPAAPLPVLDPDPFEETEPAPPTPQPPVEEELPDPDLIVEEKDISKNWKRFKTKYSKTLKEFNAEKALRAELEAKVKDFNDGAVVPEVLQEKENEIQRLSIYEKIHSVKTTKEYRQKIVEPLNQLNTQLAEIGKDYQVPKDVLDEALNLTNKRELNHFLSSHFDEAGSSEVRGIFDRIKQIQQNAKRVELEPAKVLAELRSEAQQIEAEQAANRNRAIIDKARTSWVKTLTNLRQEGEFPELIPRETDPVHNAHMTKIVQAASVEYGKAVRVLAQNGLADLPEDVAQYLSRLTLLAHSSAVNAQSRDVYAQQAERLEREKDEINQFIRPVPGRPPIYGQSNGNGKPKPMDNKEASNLALKAAGVKI